MTAVVLAEPLTPEWYEQRRRGIGASEIAAVMGISPWESPFSLFWKKLNGWENDQSPEMSAGQRLEPVIAQWWEDQQLEDGWRAATCGLVAHPDRLWQLATPDRLVYAPEPCSDPWTCATDCGGPGYKPGDEFAVLELKYVAQSWDGWGDPGTDAIPVHYRAQVQWQCDVVDVADWFLAALGPGGFREYHGHRDEKDLRVMREHGRRFMARLDAGDPPPIDDHDATLAVVKRLHPDIDDTEAEVPSTVAAGYRRACAMERKAKSAKRRYEALLRAEMGRARRATIGGSFVVSRSIYDVAEHVVHTHTVDKLNPPRSKKP